MKTNSVVLPPQVGEYIRLLEAAVAQMVVLNGWKHHGAEAPWEAARYRKGWGVRDSRGVFVVTNVSRHRAELISTAVNAYQGVRLPWPQLRELDEYGPEGLGLHWGAGHPDELVFDTPTATPH